MKTISIFLIPILVLVAVLLLWVNKSSDPFPTEEPVTTEKDSTNKKEPMNPTEAKPKVPGAEKTSRVEVQPGAEGEPKPVVDNKDKSEEKAFDPRKDKSPTRASDPIYTGFKERAASITEKDEYYLGEYTNVKFPRNQPSPKLSNPKSADLAWKLELNASVCGKAVASEGFLYFVCYDSQVFKIEAKSGQLVKKARLWYQPIGNPVEYNDTIIFPQRNGNITSVRKSDLEIVYNSRSAVTKKPDEIDISIAGIALNDNLVYVSKHWGNIYVISASTGDMLMDPGVPYESRINIPAVPWGNRFIYSNVAGELLCFSKDGKERFWKSEISAGYLLSSVQNNDRLYMTTTERKFTCYDLKGQKELWSKDLNGYGYNSIAQNGDNFIVGAGDLYSFSQDGDLNWKVASEQPQGFGRGPAVIENGVIYACEQEGGLFKVALKSGEVLSRVEVTQKPVFNHLSKLPDGKFVVSNTGNELYVVKF